MRHPFSALFWCVSGAALIVFVPLFILSFYAHPNAEGFQLSALARDLNILQYVHFLYDTIDGRYFTNMTYALNPWRFGCLECYYPMPALFISGFVASAFFLVKSAFGGVLGNRQILLLTLLTAIAFFAGMPAINTFYYMGTAFVYSLFLILFNVLLGVTLRFDSAQSFAGRQFFMALILFFIWAVLGTTEVSYLFTHALFIGYFCFNIFHRKSVRWDILLLYGFVIAFTIISATAPGTFIRMKYGQEPIGASYLPLTMENFIAHSLEAWSRFLTTPVLYVLALATLVIVARCDDKALIRFRALQNIPLWLMAAFVLLLIVTPLPYYLDDDYINIRPDRVFNIVYWFLIIGIFTGATSFALRYKTVLTRMMLHRKQSQWMFAGALAFAACFSASDNVVDSYRILLNGEAERYHQAMDERFSRLREAASRGESSAELTALPSLPAIIFHPPDVPPNRGWEGIHNKGYEDFFHLWEVYYETDTVRKVTVQ